MNILVWWLILPFLVSYTCLLCVTWGHIWWDVVVHCTTLVGYRCVEGRWWLNIGGLGGLSSDSLYVMVIGSGMSVLAHWSGVGITVVEYIVNFCVGGWVTRIGASCTGASCGIFFVFRTGRDDATVSDIVEIFECAARWSELADVVNSGKGYLSAFTNSLAATNILVLGDKIGAATSVRIIFAVAHILIPPVDGTKKL